MRREHQRQLAQPGELPRHEALERLLVVGEHAAAVVVRERAVDVAGVALALVELRHERERHALLRRDLLGAGLVDHVVVGGGERLVVAEVDLVLAEVALALRVLHSHAGAGHRVADAADQRLHARGAEDRVVDVVEVGRIEVAVALAPGLLVGVAEDDELELGARVRRPAALGEPGQLAAQDLARRGRHVGAVVPLEVRHHQRGRVMPGDDAQRVEVGAHREVAVAARPRRHRVALDGVHVHVHREQVVAPLGAVLEHLVEEVARRQPLALQPSLHVGDRQQDGVDRPAVDGGAQLLQRHPVGSTTRPVSSVVIWRTGPVNDLRAEISHHSPTAAITISTVKGA